MCPGSATWPPVHLFLLQSRRRGHRWPGMPRLRLHVLFVCLEGGDRALTVVPHQSHVGLTPVRAHLEGGLQHPAGKSGRTGLLFSARPAVRGQLEPLPAPSGCIAPSVTSPCAQCCHPGLSPICGSPSGLRPGPADGLPHSSHCEQGPWPPAGGSSFGIDQRSAHTPP